MLIQQEKVTIKIQFFLLIPFVIGIGFVYLSNELSSSNMTVLALTIMLALVIGWVSYLSTLRTVYINVEKNEITLQKTTFFYQKKTEVLNLNDYDAILSHISAAEEEMNCVELINETNGESLLLAKFNPSGSGSFFSFMPHENSKAKLLRRSVSKLTGLKDRGFSR
jgi:Tfp pilus assembly protein PilO